MGLCVVLLCIVGAIAAQQTRHQSFGTTEGRVSCLEDMYMRLQNEDARIKQQLIEKESEYVFIDLYTHYSLFNVRLTCFYPLFNYLVNKTRYYQGLLFSRTQYFTFKST